MKRQGRSSAIIGAVAAILLVGRPAGASATTIHVAADGSGDYPTIQEAIDAAVAGDVVQLGPGTFRATVTRVINGLNAVSVCFLKSGVTLQGATGGDPSILDGESHHHGMVGQDLAATTVVRHVTVMNCRTLGGGLANKWGGGMLTFRSSPVVEYCVFRDNVAVNGGGGGAIFFHQDAGSGGPVVRWCVFVDNFATDLGGAVESFEGTVCTVENNTFVGNHAGDRGGALVLNPTSGQVHRNIFVGNKADDGGGAILCIFGGTAGTCNLFWQNDAPGTPDVLGCPIPIGSNGNAIVDPLFCDVATMDYRLQTTSPGAPGFSGGCGLIGALPVGCGPPAGGPGLQVPELTAEAGATVSVPVVLVGSPPAGARSYQLGVTVDPAVLTYVGVDASGTLSEGLLVVGNSPAPGTVLVAAAGTDPIGSDATLIEIVFAVASDVPDGTRSAVAFSSFTWGEGIPPAGLTDGGVTVGEALSAGGTITYYATDPVARGVPGVVVDLTGTHTASAVSDSAGGYVVGDLWFGLDFTLTPRTDLEDLEAVSSFDATLVLGHLVQMETLDANQLLAADVTGDGSVSAEDAARILQMIVDPGAAPDPLWRFVPESIEVEDLPGTVSDLDFTAILRGDVSGNWCFEMPCSAPTRLAAADWSAAGAWLDGAFSVAVRVESAGARSLDFALDYDASRLEYAGLETAGAGMWVSHTADARVAVAGATAQPWGAGEAVVTLRFVPAQSPARRSEIVVGAVRIDESAPAERTVPVPGVHAPVGALVDFDVRISPNPAHGEVELAIVGAAGDIRVEVFNVAGRRIRSLDGATSALGERSMTWNRRDDAGNRVADGIYFIRALDGERVVTRRVVLVQ